MVFGGIRRMLSAGNDEGKDTESKVDTAIDANVLEKVSKDLSDREYNISIDMIRANVTAFEDESIAYLNQRNLGLDIENWIDGGEKHDVQVYYSPVLGNKWYTMKSSTIVHADVDKIVNILTDPEMVPKYDDMTEEVKVIQSIGEYSSIRQVSAKGVMFTSARDFCVATTVQKQENGNVMIATRSIQHPDVPERKKFVRAIAMISGFVVEKLQDGNCKVTVIAHMDLGGMIPSSVIKFLGLQAPIKVLVNIRNLAV